MPRPAQLYRGPSVLPAPVGGVRVNVGGETPLLDASGALMRGALVAKEMDQRKRKREAELQAAKDVNRAQVKNPITGDDMPALVLQTGVGDIEEAYNAAARRIYRQRLEISLRLKANELALKHRADPTALQRELTSFVAGATQAMDEDERAFFESAALTLGSPLIRQAGERAYAAQAASMEADLVALRDARLKDAQTYGQQIGVEGKGATPSYNAMIETLAQTARDIGAAVDGVTFTAGQAREAIETFTSSYMSRVLMGLYDGTADKTKLFATFLRGAAGEGIKMDLPTLDADDNVVIGAVDVTQLLSVEDLEKVRLYMSTRHSAAVTLKNQAREDNERFARDDLRQAKRDLALTGDPNMFEAIAENQFATDDDISSSRDWLKNGVTDPSYFRVQTDQILMGWTTDPLQLDPNRLDFEDRKTLMALIDDQQNAAHWSKSVNYSGAEDDIKKIVLQEVGDLVVSGATRSSNQTSLRQQAAAGMTVTLRRLAQHHADNGIVGHNPSGKSIEQVKLGKGPDGEPAEVTRFDPRNWVREQTDRLKGELEPIKARIAELRSRSRELRAKFQNPNLPKEEQQTAFDEMQQVLVDLRKAKQELNQTFTDSLIVEFE